MGVKENAAIAVIVGAVVAVGAYSKFASHRVAEPAQDRAPTAEAIPVDAAPPRPAYESWTPVQTHSTVYDGRSHDPYAGIPSVKPPRQLVPRPTVRRSAPANSSSRCCKVCSNSQPCGDSCISWSRTCHKGSGCAC